MAFTKMHVHITSGDARRKKDIFIQNRTPADAVYLRTLVTFVNRNQCFYD